MTTYGGRPVSRGGVIGLSLGRYAFVGAGVATLFAGVALAKPQGAKVVHGDVTIRERGNRTIIRAGDKAIIDYTGFDIGKGETVRFIQPSAGAKVLNRVNSEDPSRIDGKLVANGKVYIVNPAGVYFGNGALVNVGAIYAAAGTITNEDFLGDIDRVTDLRGSVVNEGTIRVEGGVAALVGRHVANAGAITADGGVIAMVAGEDVLLSERGGTTTVRVTGGAASIGGDRAGVSNTGEVRAQGGRAMMVAGDMYSLAVNNSGAVRARDIALEGRGSGEVRVSGRLDARDQGSGGAGGTVRVLGEAVALHGARIDATGAAGGGTVLVGGGYRGEGATARARTTTVDAASTIRADGRGSGDGGTVVVWSNERTEFHGRATARAGAGGSGGLVETSSKGEVDFGGAVVDARGRGGDNGTWLIDPTNVNIDASQASSIVATLETGTDVQIDTGTTGTDDGDITVSASILKDAGGEATLTLRAADDVAVQDGVEIRSTNDSLNVQLLADNADGVTDPSPGAGEVVLGANSVIDTNGGALTIEGRDLDIGAGATVTANGGVTIRQSQAASTLGIESSGDMALTAAELRQVSSTGTVTIGREDGGAVAIGADGDVNLSGRGYDLVIRGGAATVSGELTTGGDVTLESTGDIAVTDGIESAGVMTLTADGSVTLGGDSRATGGSITADNGVEIQNDLTLTAGDLAIDADADNDGTGTFTVQANRTVATTNNDLSVTAADVNLAGSINAGGGDVTIARSTGGDIALGQASGAMTITGGELGRITARMLTIGGEPTTAIVVNGLTEEQTENITGGITLDAGTTLTFNGNASTFRTLTGTADAGIAVEVDLTTTGDLTLNADADENGAGTLTVLTGRTIDIGEQDLVVSAADLELFGSISGGVGSVTIDRSTTGAVAVGSQTVSGALTVDGTELSRITVNTLTIGGENTDAITVGGVAAAQSQNIATKLRLESAGPVSFTGGASTFNTLEVVADDGVTVGSNLTADAGELTIDADADEDGTGSLVVGAGVAVATSDQNASITAADLDLSGGLSTGTGDVTITRSTAGTIGVGAVTTAAMTISGDELSRITAGDLTIGGGPTTTITVRSVTAAQSDGISGVTTLDAGNALIFSGGASTFNAVSGQADNGIRFNANLTAATGDLTLDGDADDAADSLDGIFFASGRTLRSGGKITLSSTSGEISGAGDLTMLADNVVTINNTTDVTGTAVIDADADDDGTGTFLVVIGATLGTSGGTLDITAADFDLPGGLSAGTGQITIDRSSRGSIAVGTGDGDMEISNAELGRVTAAGLTIGGLTTDLVTVSGVTGAASNNVAGAITFRALSATGRVDFATSASTFNGVGAVATNNVDVRAALTADAGNIALEAGAGDGIGSVRLSANVTAPATGDVRLDGPVVLQNNVTVAGNDVRFNSSVDSDGSSPRTLTVNTSNDGVTEFNGDVGLGQALGTITTNADGLTRLGANMRTETGGMIFNDAVRLTDDVVLRDEGSAGIFFNSTLDSARTGPARSLTVLVGTDVRPNATSMPVIGFGGSVGARDALENLYLNYNPETGRNRRDFVPRVATIVVRPRNSTGQAGAVTSLNDFEFVVNDTFRMGRNEKLTAGGNVSIQAGDAAVIGDVSALGDIRVDAPEIQILTRRPGSVALSTGGTSTRPAIATDRGVDIAAGGRLDFSTTPEAVGDGPGPSFAAGEGAGGVSEALAGFVVQSLGDLSFRAIDFGSPVTTLDLIATGPSQTNFATALAGAIPPEARYSDVAEDAAPGEIDTAMLERLGISLRNPTSEEFLAFLAGFSTYDDYALDGAESRVRGTLVRRLPRERLSELAAAYAELFGTDDAEAGSRSEEIRLALEASVARYREGGPEAAPVDPVAFRRYLETTPEEAASLAYVERLGSFLAQLENIGLTARELRISKSVLLNPVRPRGIADLQAFETVIKADPDAAPVDLFAPPMPEPISAR